MVRLLSLILIPFLLTFLFFSIIGFLKPQIVVKYNGNVVSFHGDIPFMYDDGHNSSIVVPAEPLSEAIGASVYKNEKEKSLTVKKGKNTIVFYDGSNTALVNGKKKDMPVSVFIRNNSYWIPVKFMCENLKHSVFWEWQTSSVSIFNSMESSFDPNTEGMNYVSLNNFVVGKDRLIFNVDFDESYSGTRYVPDDKLNPLINKQLFDMARMIPGKRCYLNIEYRYVPAKGNSDPAPNISVSVYRNRDEVTTGDFLFSFTFYEKTPVNPRERWGYRGFTQKALIKMQLRNLDDLQTRQNTLYYAERLKLAYVALFGENTGLNIYDFIMKRYDDIRNDKDGSYADYKITRRFDNVRVDFCHPKLSETPDTIYCYFSY